jgi:hypothetical protein
MKATIVEIGPTYRMGNKCDICTGREGRRYDAKFTFDCGSVLKGLACSPCWKKYAPGQVIDLQAVSEHVHLNDDKRVWRSIGQARELFTNRIADDKANLVGEPGGTEYELVQPEVRGRVYRHYGDAPCPWKPAPIPETVTEQLLTILREEWTDSTIASVELHFPMIAAQMREQRAEARAAIARAEAVRPWAT